MTAVRWVEWPAHHQLSISNDWLNINTTLRLRSTYHALFILCYNTHKIRRSCISCFQTRLRWFSEVSTAYFLSVSHIFKTFHILLNIYIPSCCSVNVHWNLEMSVYKKSWITLDLQHKISKEPCTFFHFH